MVECARQSMFARMPDEKVVALSKNGNPGAAEYLLRKYKSVVSFKCRLYFLHGADRDDVIQEGMIGLFKAIRDFKSNRACSFRSFADTCITRQIITAVKKSRRKRQLPLSCAVSLSQGGDSEEDEGKPQLEVAAEGEAVNPEELLIVRESVRELRAVLRERLSEFEWNALVAFLAGKSYPEIAKEQGRTSKQIDNAICRARRKLYKWQVEQELQECDI